MDWFPHVRYRLACWLTSGTLEASMTELQVELAWLKVIVRAQQDWIIAARYAHSHNKPLPPLPPSWSRWANPPNQTG